MSGGGLRARLPSGRRLARLLVIAALLGLILLGAGSAGLHLWGRYHFRKAQHALDRHQLAETNRHLEVCLRLWPRNPPTLLFAARAARQADQLPEADSFLRAYHKHGGDTADPEYVLESTLLRAQRGEVDAVLAQCQRWVEQDHPAAARILQALAQGYLSRHRVPDAEVTVRIWLDRLPDDPQAVYFAGWVKEHHNVPEKAAEDYRRAMALDPTRDDIRLRLASCLMGSAQASAALELLEDLCQRHGDHAPTRLLRARALYAAGRLADARAALDALLADFPNYPPALTERGRLALQGNEPGAERWLAEAVGRAPGDSQAWYLLSQVHGRRGQAKQAAAALARFQDLGKDQARMREIATREMSRRPRDPALHAEIGGILLRAGEAREALRSLKRALALDPNHAEAHALLAEYYARIGQIGLASRHRQLAGAAAPEGKK